jgi:hypothetical protein
MEADTANFLEALAEGMPPTERLIMCGFSGDPGHVPKNAWKPRPWTFGREPNLGDYDNAYVSVSSFFRGGDGSFRRRAENFAAGRALMVDDVGTKVPLAKMTNAAGVPILRPSAIVETSPKNVQWWYFLREPERMEEKFDSVIRAFIHSRLMGEDPGMSGVTRVGRIPGYWNTKSHLVSAKSPKGWKVALRKLYAVRYSLDELLGYFELQPKAKPWTRDAQLLETEELINRVRAWKPVALFLRSRGMLKRDTPDPSGWIEATCPWRGEHTGNADTGAAIRIPEEENGYYGAFRCHHGHCAERGWRELTDWVTEECAASLDAAAASAVPFNPEATAVTNEETQA